MSATIFLGMDVDTGGEAPYELVLWDRNITYNLGAMWKAVGWDFHGLEGLEASTQYSRVVNALAMLKADPEKYQEMNPPNGWGNYEALVEFFEELVQAISTHPKAIISTSL